MMVQPKVWTQMSMECMPHVIVPALSLVSTPLWIVYAYGGEEFKNFVGVSTLYTNTSIHASLALLARSL